MPFPIRKTKDQMISENNNLVESQNIMNLIPLLQIPLTLLQDIKNDSRDKEKIKSIWLSSEVMDDKKMRVSGAIQERDLDELHARGLIDVVDTKNRLIALTDRGSKLLRDAILSDDKSEYSFTKKASKQLVSKNSFDFGDEVLVKVNNPEKFGSKYITISKSAFKNKKAKPQSIDNYDVQTRKANGDYKELSDYTDEELIKVLHLAKRIVANTHKVITAGTHLEQVPTNRIKAFAQFIFNELNNPNRDDEDEITEL